MSKKSSHHRVKRNQQLIEAQRLLEGHTMRGDTEYDFDSINRRSNQSIGQAYSSSDEHKVFLNGERYSNGRTDTHDTHVYQEKAQNHRLSQLEDPKRQSTKEIGLNGLSSLNIAPTKM